MGDKYKQDLYSQLRDTSIYIKDEKAEYSSGDSFMYCDIQKDFIKTTIDLWSTTIDFLHRKICNFYILSSNLNDFFLACEFFNKELNLVDRGGIELPIGSTSLVDQLLSLIPTFPPGNNSLVCKNFAEAWGEHENWYTKTRFGHDYNQEMIENSQLNFSLSSYSGKIIIFTWVDSNNSDLVQTAITSRFKDGICHPVKHLNKQQ